jgi:hypothetical protein
MSIKRRVIGGSVGGFRTLYETGDENVQLRVQQKDGAMDIEVFLPSNGESLVVSADEAVELYMCMSDLREYVLDLGEARQDEINRAMTKTLKAYDEAFRTVPDNHPLKGKLRKWDKYAIEEMLSKATEPWLLYKFAKLEEDKLTEDFTPNIRLRELPMYWIGDLVEVALDRHDRTVQSSFRKKQGQWMAIPPRSIFRFIGAVARCADNMGIIHRITHQQRLAAAEQPQETP